jgi:hypothetical protein
MKLETVWTRLVVVIYLVAVIGVCLYVPMYEAASYMPINRIIFNGTYRGIELFGFRYDWVWTLGGEFNGGGGFTCRTVVDAFRVVWEVVGLTTIAGVLFLIGSLVGGRKRGKQSDPVNRA